MGTPAILSSVPNVNPYIQYVATNGQTVFPFPFPLTQDSDLVVVINGVTQPTDSGYTLSGVGQVNGGNLTFTAGQTGGAIITMFRNIAIQRITQISQNSGYASSTLNAEFNNIYLLLQQLQESLGFSLQVPSTNTPLPTTTLTPAAYANKFLSFDANGNPVPAAVTTLGGLTAALIGSLLWPGPNALTAGIVGSLITPPTAAELAVGLVLGASPGNIVNEFMPVGDARRYGGIGNGVADDTAAVQAAINQSGSNAIGAVPAYVPGGSWLNTGLNLMYGSTLGGAGMFATNLITNTGSAGIGVDAYGLFPTISGITKATQAVVTITTVSGANPFAGYIGQAVTCANVVGMTQMNGLACRVSAVGGVSGAWTVTLGNINSTGYSNYVSGGNLTASASGSVLKDLTVTMGVTGGYALRYGNAIQNCKIDHVAAFYTGGASANSAAINFNGNSSGAFSGLMSINHFYAATGGANPFQYGFLFQNAAGNKTWTTITCTGCQLIGGAAAGSIGIWEDGNSDNVGSTYFGGTIEGWAKPYQLDAPGNSGMHIHCDVEGNTNPGTVYPFASFDHRTEYSSTNEPSWWWQDAPPGNTQIWSRYQQWNGNLVEEQFHNRDMVILSDSTLPQRVAIRAGSSLIGGGSPSFVGGVSVQPAGLTNPNNNWMYASNGSNKICWGTAAPTGGTWTAGDICILTSPATNAPVFAVCTVGGTPGTWVTSVNILQAAQTGWGVPTAGSVVANFPGSGATTAQCGSAITEIILVLKSFGLMAA